MTNSFTKTFLAAFVAVMVSISGSAYADDGQIMSMVKDLQSQMKDMQKTINWQKDKINSLEGRKAAYVSPGQESDGVEVPGWLTGLDFFGDLRLRYEALDMVDSAGKATTAAARDRNRFRYRLRFGFKKKLHPDMEVGFRLVSAQAGARDSTNTTLDTGFSFKPVSIDTAYATYKPGWAEVGPIESLQITAGKFSNPFTEGSSFIKWDSDVRPEGLYEKIVVDAFQSEDVDVKFSALAGQLILEEGAALASHDDAELWAWQTGLHGKIKGILEKPIETKHLISYYDYKDFTSAGNFAGNFGGNTAGTGGQAGTLAAGDFDIINVYNEVAVQVAGMPKAKLFFDYYKNTDSTAPPGEIGSEDAAWGIGAKIGKAKKKGSWEASYTYANIEANAVPDLFTDSDFGGSDRRGSVVKLGYALTDRLKLGAAAIFNNRISADSRVSDQERRLFQLDLIWKI